MRGISMANELMNIAVLYVSCRAVFLSFFFSWSVVLSSSSSSSPSSSS